MLKNLMIATLVSTALLPQARAEGRCADPALSEALKKVELRLAQVSSSRELAARNHEAREHAHTGALASALAGEGLPIAGAAVVVGAEALWAAGVYAVFIGGAGATNLIPAVLLSGVTAAGITAGVPAYLAYSVGTEQIEALESQISVLPLDPASLAMASPADLSAKIAKVLATYREYHLEVGRRAAIEEAELEHRSTVANLGWNNIKELKLMSMADEAQVALYDLETRFLEQAQGVVGAACAQGATGPQPSVSGYDAAKGSTTGCEDNRCVLNTQPEQASLPAQ